jgi:3-oxoadipate enol-lactonase
MPYAQLRDIQLYYEETGRGQPLLFLHGLGSSGRDWELQVDAFSNRYRVITADMRGHGRSDKPHQAYSVAMFADDVRQLFGHLEIAAGHLVGISMGGMIAFQLAIDAPEMVRSMVIVNSAPELIPRTMGQRLEVWRRLLIARLLGMRKIGQVLGGRLFPEPHQDEMRQVFTERWAENDRTAYLAATRALIGWSVQQHIGLIQCPVLVLASDMDYTPVALKAAYVAQMPTARLQVIANSRHAMPVDQSKAFNNAVDNFLKLRSA